MYRLMDVWWMLGATDSSTGQVPWVRVTLPHWPTKDNLVVYSLGVLIVHLLCFIATIGRKLSISVLNREVVEIFEIGTALSWSED